MSIDIFAERERALEDEFFYKVDQQLCRQLREQMQTEKDREALCAETGILSSEVLDELIAIGIRCETLLALSLVPLVQVAWANGTIDSRERQAVLQAAESIGHSKENASYQMLDSWLNHKPDNKVYIAWRDYVIAICQALNPVRVKALREEIVGRARSVAESAGGVLGFGTISRAEATVLSELESAFSEESE
jgi:hypothetical protein